MDFPSNAILTAADRATKQSLMELGQWARDLAAKNSEETSSDLYENPIEQAIHHLRMAAACFERALKESQEKPED